MNFFPRVIFIVDFESELRIDKNFLDFLDIEPGGSLTMLIYITFETIVYIYNNKYVRAYQQ